jgi:hypothetical protein
VPVAISARLRIAPPSSRKPAGAERMWWNTVDPDRLADGRYPLLVMGGTV